MDTLCDEIFFGEQTWVWEIFKINIENTLIFLSQIYSLAKLMVIGLDLWRIIRSGILFVDLICVLECATGLVKTEKTWVDDGGKSFDEF
jgi:hypothetical protein